MNENKPLYTIRTGKTSDLLMEDYLPYIDKFGLVQPEPDGRSSQNGIRFTAECILAINTHFKKDAPIPLQAFLDERIKAIFSCQLLPGLLRRHPESTEQVGPDDYYAACAVGYLYSPKLAQDIYRYGKANKFVFDNDGNKKIGDWLGRNPTLKSFMKFCAGEKLNCIDVLAISIGIYLSAGDKSQDGKVLTWFIVRCMKYKGFGLIDRAIIYWQNKLKEHYAFGIGGCLAKYFHPQHDSHPSAVWLKGVCL